MAAQFESLKSIHFYILENIQLSSAVNLEFFIIEAG